MDKIQKTTDLIVRDFGIRAGSIKIKSDPGKAYNALKEKLAIRIADMLENDWQRLSNIFYRLDVSESKVTRVLKSVPIPEVPYQLAELVIDRQLQKVYWQNKFSGKD